MTKHDLLKLGALFFLMVVLELVVLRYVEDRLNEQLENAWSQGLSDGLTLGVSARIATQGGADE